jgi:DtxR family manganese transport transcriptional regulator
MANHSEFPARTREDHATEIAEDYVEAIADITADRNTCRTVDLARRFGVTPVTVNRTLGRLQRDGYIETEAYGPVFLTAKGKRVAKAAKARHTVVLEFLIALGVRPAVAEIDSEGMEHHASPETLNAMRRFIATQTPSG